MGIAAILALIFQFGTTGAALIIMIFTSTFGLGCLSMGYIIYGVFAIVIMLLTIFSTILARISETRRFDGCHSCLKRIAKPLAIATRYTCWTLAFLNSVGMIALCCLQFSNLLDNCYCNSNVLGNGPVTYIIIILTDPTPMEFARGMGILIAAGSILIFTLGILFLK